MLRRATPPLLPLSPPLSPYEAPNASHEMELTSTPENLFAKEAADVEAQLFQNDAGTHEFGTSSRTFGGQNTSDDIQDLTKTPTMTSSSPLRQKRLRDLKAETPLLHQEPDTSPAKRTKTVSFPEELHTMIPAPDTDDSIMDPDVARQDVDAFVTDVIAPLAQSVIDQAGSEKLDEFDTTLRVRVPAIEPVEPVPPWDSSRESSLTRPNEKDLALLSRIEKEVPPERKKWSGTSKLEQLLPWTPFPRYLGKVSIDEQFDDGSCERYMAELTLDDNTSNIDTLLWKPEGIRLLDRCDDDDEDLELAGIEYQEEEASIKEATVEKVPAMERFSATVRRANLHQTHPEESVAKQPLAALHTTRAAEPATVVPPPAAKPEPGRISMQALLQKRKLDLESGSRPGPNTPAEVASTMPKHLARDDKAANNTDLNLGRSDLRSFLGLQGAQMPEVDQSRVPLQTKRPAMSTSTVAVQSVPEPADAVQRLTLPSPVLADSGRTMSVIVSSNILGTRGLVREVQAHLPNLELIERDSAGLVSASEKARNACEADFTLSPGAGLICTTLQKLKQRPLPGQRDFFGIRERIAAVSPRYERCIVLVSEGKQDDMLPASALDERDATAVSELIGFTNTLESSVEVSYVDDGETELATWIAASICRFACSGDNARLLNEETMWERLLRIAGANPAAAQTILVHAKRPGSGEANDSSSSFGGSSSVSYGLSAFVQMSAEERIQTFGPLMGGERVLGRVSEAIDGPWISARER